MKIWKLTFLAIMAMFVVGTPSQAQITPGGGVQQSGTVTPGNCVSWLQSGSIKDAGAPCGSGGGAGLGANTFTGAQTAPTFNVPSSSTTGYQFNGITNLFSQNGTGSLGVGGLACGNVFGLGSSGEDLCVGNNAGRDLGIGATINQAVHDAYVGSFAFAFDRTGSFTTGVGNDVGRNAYGINNGAYLGDLAGQSYFGSAGTFLGAFSMRGNSASVQVSSPANGDTVNLTIANAAMSGSPITLQSAVTGASTPASIVADLATKMSADPRFFAVNIYPNTNTQVPGLAGVLGINHQGTDSIGDTITVTVSVTGSPGTTVVTQSYGSTSSANLVGVGYRAMDGLQITSATNDGCGGLWCLSSLTSGSNDWTWGNGSLQNLTSGSNITAGGANSGSSLNSAGNCAFFGTNSFSSATTSCGSGIGYNIAASVTIGAPDVVGNSTLDRINNASATVAVGSQTLEGASGSASTNSAQNSAVVGFRNFQNVTNVNRLVGIGQFLGTNVVTTTDSLFAGYNLCNNLTGGFSNVLIGFGGSGNATSCPTATTAGYTAIWAGNTAPVFSITGGTVPNTSIATIPGFLTLGIAAGGGGLVGSGSGITQTVVGTGAGTGSPSVTPSANSHALDGTVTVVTGTAPAGSAAIATLSLGLTFPTAPVCMLTPANSNAAALNATNAIYPTSTQNGGVGSSSQLILNSGTTGLTAATTYVWTYLCAA